jgi:type I restriction enzyme R subunit
MHQGRPGDRRAGVVWHTQGSGKSFTMLFYAARVIREAAMQNPTLVVLTDRNDLDDQLFGQFQRCHDILGQMPVQAANRAALRGLLAVASGGVVFTTIQKFLPAKGTAMPELSARRNIIVIADEAHRSQYDLVDGLARHLRDALPKATFIGFTGTPIEKTDANTRAVFGDYISIYDIQRAVADKATVPIYYESRIARLGLNAAALPTLDAEFDTITDAGPRADAGHRPREPRVSRQARWLGGRLPRSCRPTQEGAGHLHRQWRPRRPDLRHGTSHRGDAGETRHRLRPAARLRLGSVDHGEPG